MVTAPESEFVNNSSIPYVDSTFEQISSTNGASCWPDDRPQYLTSGR